MLYPHRPNPMVDELMRDSNAWKLVISIEFYSEVLFKNHVVPQAGHLGSENTFQRIAQLYYWPSLFRSVVGFVKRCDICQAIKADQHGPSSVMLWRAFDKPWFVVAADIVGPLPKSKSGYVYLLVIQDLFSKWIELCPLRKATGQKIADAFYDVIINRWGTPRRILTDNGTEFVNTKIKKLATGNGIKLYTTPIYTPRANPVERVNRVVKTMIMAFIQENHREWDKHLPEFRFAYNTAYHTSLQATPAFVNFGHELTAEECLRAKLENNDERIPDFDIYDLDELRQRLNKLKKLRKLIVDNLHDAHETQANRYNAHRKPRLFSVGDLVMVRNRVLSSGIRGFAASLADKFVGPYRVERVISRNVYVISDPNSRRVTKVSVDDLKRYIH